MMKLDDNGLCQCAFESKLFEYSTTCKNCSSKAFVKAYVYSSVQRRVASKTFVFDSLDIVSAFETIRKEKIISQGNDIYPSYVMAWIGYIMRYFCSTTNIPETVLYKKIKPEELYGLYESYHSLDNDLVVTRIAESKNININIDNAALMKAISML